MFKYLSICLFLISLQVHGEENLTAAESLIEVLTPHYEGLKDNLEISNSSSHAKSISKSHKAPNVVKAYAAKIEYRSPATVHMGYYSDSTIMTFVNDPTGNFPTGAQVIGIGTTPVSYSTQWVNEVVSGISYVKHTHDTCYVYSTDFSQFVVFK